MAKKSQFMKMLGINTTSLGKNKPPDIEGVKMYL